MNCYYNSENHFFFKSNKIEDGKPISNTEEKYCVWCNKPMNPKTEWDDYTEYVSYYCECEESAELEKFLVSLRDSKREFEMRKGKYINKFLETKSKEFVDKIKSLISGQYNHLF